MTTLVAELADGSLAQWAGRVGKLLLLVAGLAVLLDLVGSERLARWNSANAARRSAILHRLRWLRAAQRLESLQDRMMGRIALNRGLSSPYFTTEEFAELVRTVRAHPEYRRGGYYIQPISQRQVIAFLDSKVSLEEREILATSEREKGRGRGRAAVGALLIRGVMVGTLVYMVIGTTLKFRPTSSQLIVIMAVFLVAGVTGIAMTFHRSILDLRAAVSTAGLWLTRAALTLVDREGSAHPLRWAALMAFLAGSLLDLIVTW